jgi:phosphinothricin acetyltransferase
MTDDITVRQAELSDAGSIVAIYNHYVAHTVVTFEEEPVQADEMRCRIDDVKSVSLPWLIAEQHGQTAGYAYAAPWKARSAYRFSAEITVYVPPERARRGIGSILYGRLLPILQAQGVHAVLGGIALPNEASIALHEKFRFRKVAHLHQIGFKFNRWIDVGYWQRLL